MDHSNGWSSIAKSEPMQDSRMGSHAPDNHHGAAEDGSEKNMQDLLESVQRRNPMDTHGWKVCAYVSWHQALTCVAVAGLLRRNLEGETPETVAACHSQKASLARLTALNTSQAACGLQEVAMDVNVEPEKWPELKQCYENFRSQHAIANGNAGAGGAFYGVAPQFCASVAVAGANPTEGWAHVDDIAGDQRAGPHLPALQLADERLPD
ncbi:MAG: hypothetical protein HC868_12035 [Sphingomonadales bacterium]|nr:hypothetical protein [Sphingomonadales bacterium]